MNFTIGCPILFALSAERVGMHGTIFGPNHLSFQPTNSKGDSMSNSAAPKSKAPDNSVKPPVGLDQSVKPPVGNVSAVKKPAGLDQSVKPPVGQ